MSMTFNPVTGKFDLKGSGGGGGGVSISTPHVAYVESDGDNGTAVIGDPSKPFATAQAAYDAAMASGLTSVNIHLGISTDANRHFGNVMTNASGWPNWITLSGVNYRSSRIDYIIAQGQDATSSGESGGNAPALYIVGDHNVGIRGVQSTGGQGQAGAVGSSGELPSTGQNGGDGGDSSVVHLENLVIYNFIANGGAGGNGGNGGDATEGGSGANGGNGGTGGDIICPEMLRVVFDNEYGGGIGGTTGTPGTEGSGGGGGGGGGSGGTPGAGGIVSNTSWLDSDIRPNTCAYTPSMGNCIYNGNVTIGGDYGGNAVL